MLESKALLLPLDLVSPRELGFLSLALQLSVSPDSTALRAKFFIEPKPQIVEFFLVLVSRFLELLSKGLALL